MTPRPPTKSGEVLSPSGAPPPSDAASEPQVISLSALSVSFSIWDNILPWKILQHRGFFFFSRREEMMPRKEPFFFFYFLCGRLSSFRWLSKIWWHMLKFLLCTFVPSLNRPFEPLRKEAGDEMQLWTLELQQCYWIPTKEQAVWKRIWNLPKTFMTAKAEKVFIVTTQP